MTSTLDGLAKGMGEALVPGAPPMGAVQRRLGVCGAVAAGPPPTATVTVGGTAIAGVRFLDSASAANGDVVVVDFTGSDPLIVGKLRTSALGAAGGQFFNTGLELYQSASTPYIDFHRAADPSGDSGADYNVRLINDVNGELRLFGGYRVNSGDASGESFIGPWGTSVAYTMIGSNARRSNSAHYNMLFSGGAGDVSTYISPSHTGGSIRLRYPYNGADIAAFNTDGTVVFFNGTGATKHKFWDDGELWCNDIGLGIADNPNGSGIFFSSAAGELNMQNRAIILSGVNNDTTHRVYHDTVGADGPHISGFSGLQFLFSNGAGTLQWDNGGQLYTNYGCGLDGGWVLQSRYAGAATGGALLTKSGGNRIRFDWTGSGFEVWVDVTRVQVGKTFVIDHPSDADAHLVHACIEGPEVAVFYRGEGVLEGEWVEVRLPDYFEYLCATDGRSVMLTAMTDSPDVAAPQLSATYPRRGRFFVGRGSGAHLAPQRFWWQVTAVRKDVPPLVVEPRKDAVVVRGDGPYTYVERTS